MSGKTFVLVGNWHYKPSPKGFSVFSFDPDTASMEMIETAFEDLGAGQQTMDEDRRIAYVVNEIQNQRGQVGGGGYVVAIKVDSETGHLSMMNEKKSLAPSPSYICLDKSKKYCIVVHHVVRGHATKVFRDEKTGAYDSKVLFDDAAIVLFRIQEDGSLGEICDVAIHSGEGPFGPHMISHLHSVVADPSGELFLICDKGLDKIYSYALDRENGKLVLLNETQLETEVWPRYGAFHPTLPVFYSNNEKSQEVFCFRYDVSNGKLERFAQILTRDQAHESQDSEPSDLTVHPNGKFLYACDRGSNTVSVMDIDPDGTPHLKQCIDCGGENPRAICISPDARYLVIANSDTASLDVFTIGPDGTLSLHKRAANAPCPATIQFMTMRD